MEIAITPESFVVFLIFVVVVFLAYKALKFIFRLLMIAAISFSFPWIAKFLHLPIPVNADLHTAVQFMLLGIALFVIYEFWHIIKAVLSLLLKPFKWIFRK